MVTFEGLSHIGLDVDDLDRSERFYTEVLGGTVLWRMEGPRPHLDVVFGNQGLTIFQGERGEGSLSARTVPRSTHFAFRAKLEDVDVIMARLERHDVYVDGPVGHWSTERTGSESRALSWYFGDPDGYRLEFDVVFPTHQEAKEELERRGGHVGAPRRSQTVA